MKKNHLSGFNIFIITGLILFIAVSGCTTETPLRLCVSHIRYDLNIQATQPISNATFYLPLPVKNGKPMIGNMLLNQDNFSRDDFSIDFVESPPGFNLTGADFMENNHPWFLKISSDSLCFNITGSASYTIEIYNHTSSTNPDIFTETLYPVGNESIFLPKIDYSQLPREKINSGSPEWIEYKPVERPYKTLIFVDYSASSTTCVKIYSSILEDNSWVKPAIPYTANYGIDGGGNDYTDSYSWTCYGDSHGWQEVDGRIRSINSVYPDLSHPVWKEMLDNP